MEQNYRHELKFLISRQTSEMLKLQLPHVMQRDSHAGPAGRYTIRSLYFDGPDFEAFYEKVSGVDNRMKFRIRCYDYSDSVFKLEKKEKKGSLTRKTAETLTPEQARALELGNDPPGQTGALTRQLRLLCTGRGLRPVVLVDYDRTAFVCHAGNTRITLDENLRTLPYAHDLHASHGAMIPVMEPDQVILEVKFDDFLPGYLSDFLTPVPKIPMAISKFAMCLQMI